MLSLALFLLPWTWFGGVALQAAGFYLFALILPLLYFSSHPQFLENKIPFKSIAIGLISLWGVYPLSSCIRVLMEGASPELSLETLFSSEMSSVFLGSGLCFGVLSKTPSLPKISTNKSPHNSVTLFFYGLLTASVAWWLLLLYQHVTGWDVHGPEYHLAPEHRLKSGFYRVFGFFGHPLSVSGVSLHIFLMSSVFCIYTWSQKNILRIVSLIISLLQIHNMIMTGGRTAIFSACLVLAFVAFRKLRFWVTALSGVCVLFFFWLFSFWDRFAEVFRNYQTGLVPDRVKFWKVHTQLFLDSPFFGAGYAFLDSIREDMFFKLGFGSLRDHFNAHNMYLETLAVTGILGFLISIFGFIKLNNALRYLKPKDKNAQILRVAFTFAIVGNLLHGFTQNVFQDSNVSYCVLGCFFSLFWLSHESSSTT